MAFANEALRSTNFLAMVGLNTVPTARMDEEGTARVGVSTLDPYNHAFIGMQIAKPLYVNLRQSMEVSSIGQKPEMVYPGMDLKLRLAEEGRYRPEIAFGMDSALGSKRFSSEYFALSKRVYDFDFTAGLAWGRMGSGGLGIANPLARLSGHFKQGRDYNDHDAASPGDWFTGNQMGFFGGVEYYTPIEGLSFKADVGADRYSGERRDFKFNAPAPWSVGFNYNPAPWFGFGTSIIGGDKVMARLTFQDNLYKRKLKSYKDRPSIAQGDGFFEKLWAKVERGGDNEPALQLGKPAIEGKDISAVLHLNDYQPSTLQIGRAAKFLLTKANKDTQSITVIPARGGIKGKAVTFSRRDLDHMLADKISPEEVWQDVSFTDHGRSVGGQKLTDKFKFIPELSFSLGEEETTHLYRTSALVERRKAWAHGFSSGGAVRLNIADNLHRLFKFRDVNLKSVRGDADLFTINRINVDRTYLSWMRTIIPDLHLALTAGYLEEMYAGAGGEVLYRPFDSPFAIGAEAWDVFKRDGLTPLALGLRGDNGWTGHLNLYYDVPDTDITTFVKAGKFLGGDVGVTGGAETQFENGMKIKGYVTATNSDDKDVFGSTRNVIAGLQLSVPLGNLKFIPEGSEARVKMEPLGRDDGQLLDKPVSLYDATEPMSYRHLGRNWQEVQN